jgi:hypothetical protein
MDRKALNYDSSATINGACYYQDTTKVFGCMDTKAKNFDPKATVGGPCFYQDTTKVFGCMDPNANNYDIKAVVPGACFYNDTTLVFGCLDPKALNYDPKATKGGTCYYNDTTKVNIYGCTNPDAYNFNPYANKDNGSCINIDNTFFKFGCTDPSAPNFDPAANRNDGSCRYVYDKVNVVNIKGCMDPLAYNYNGFANIMDNSCLYQTVKLDTAAKYVKEELKDTLGAVSFDKCTINYNLPIDNAYIDYLTNVGVDSVMATWIVVQSDGNKTYNTTYLISNPGKQLFVFTIVCPFIKDESRVSSTTYRRNSFGDVAEILMVTDVKESTNAVNTFSLFPIPANNTINFTSSTTGTLSIVNLLGETELSVNVTGTQGNIDLSSLQAGTYVYKFVSTEGIATGKLLKQ